MVENVDSESLILLIPSNDSSLENESWMWNTKREEDFKRNERMMRMMSTFATSTKRVPSNHFIVGHLTNECETEMSPLPKTLSHVERIKDRIGQLKHMKSDKRKNVSGDSLVEEKYVKSMHDLATCRKNMMMSFQDNKSFEFDIDGIFGNVDVIVGLNDILLDNLRRGNEEENNDTIGKIFMKFAPFLKLYSVYLKHLEDSMKLVAKYSKKDESFKSHCTIL